MRFYAIFATLLWVAGIIPLVPQKAMADACAEGKRCAPVRPTLAQCAQRISQETGDTTYVDLVTQAPEYIPLDRAIAIAHHNLCYGAPPYAPIFLTEEEANPVEGAFGGLKWSAFKEGASAHWGISYETVPFHKVHLAFVKHKVGDAWVVDAHTPPSWRAVTQQVLSHHIAYLTKQGVRSYASWYRFGFSVSFRVDNLTSGFSPLKPPDVGFGLSYKINQDVSVFANYTIPANDWIYGVSASVPLLRMVGNLIW